MVHNQPNMKLTCSVAAALLLALPTVAHAQSAPAQAAPAAAQPGQPQQVAAPSGTAVSSTGQVLYPTPMQQTHQDSYVPQSVAMSGPDEISSYDEGDKVPSGYHAEQRMRKGLVIAGGAVFGGFYLGSAGLAALGQDVSKNGGGRNDLAPLFIPIAGPFITMANSSTAFGDFLLAIDGGAQIAGATMAIIGLTMPKTILVRNDVGTASVTITPVIGGRTAGVVGTF
jgi:hypothetical protein